MLKGIVWENLNGAIADATIRKMSNDGTLTITTRTDDMIIVRWSDGEFETFNKTIRK